MEKNKAEYEDRMANKATSKLIRAVLEWKRSGLSSETEWKQSG